jgi:hypothetical protein
MTAQLQEHASLQTTDSEEEAWILLPPKTTDRPSPAEIREIIARSRNTPLMIPPKRGVIRIP